VNTHFVFHFLYSGSCRSSAYLAEDKNKRKEISLILKSKNKILSRSISLLFVQNNCVINDKDKSAFLAKLLYRLISEEKKMFDV